MNHSAVTKRINAALGTKAELAKAKRENKKLRGLLSEAADRLDRWGDPNTGEPDPLVVAIRRALKRK